MKIYVDGFERSGNTFLSSAIGFTLGVETIPMFSHRISTLQDRDRAYPFIVPLRDILPTITSSKLYRDYCWDKGIQSNERTGDPDELIQRFSDYVDYLATDKDLFIAPFDEFTKDHTKVIQVIAKTFPGLNVNNILTADEVIKRSDHPELFATPYLNNFPRQAVPEREETLSLFTSRYTEQIKEIQNKINALYLRYYEMEKNGNLRKF